MDAMPHLRISVMLVGATLLAACAGGGSQQASPSLAVRVAAPPAAAPGNPWMFFVSWTGERGGVAVTGMSEVPSTVGPIRQWADVLALADRIREANPGLSNVEVINFELLRIE